MEEDKQLQKRRQIAEEHERTFLSVSSMEVSSDFVDVNIDEESDKEFSGSEESIKYAFSSCIHSAVNMHSLCIMQYATLSLKAIYKNIFLNFTTCFLNGLDMIYGF